MDKRDHQQSHQQSHQQRTGRVLAYLETHLDDDIDIPALAVMACYSEFHFHRLFRAFVGESIYQFRKRLLLERSVGHLRYSSLNITEIALNCGYENQSSYNKAFKRQFSVTPSEVRESGMRADLSLQKPLVKERAIMKVEVVKMDDINVISARVTGPYHESAPEAWGKIMAFAYKNRLMTPKTRSIGLSHDDPHVTGPGNVRYDACLDLDIKLPKDSGLKNHSIEGGQYARLLHRGSYEGFQDAYDYIFGVWLAESGCVLRDLPCFEVYLNRDPRRTKPENLRTEIYVPVSAR